MITWQETYCIGVEKIDEQHKNLFQYCNDLDGVLQDGDVSKQALDFALTFLERYVISHFNQEENCLHENACPNTRANQLEHQKFILIYRAFEKKIRQETDSYGILKELHAYLENWLVEHVCKIETQLKDVPTLVEG